MLGISKTNGRYDLIATSHSTNLLLLNSLVSNAREMIKTLTLQNNDTMECAHTWTPLYFALVLCHCCAL